LLACLFACLFVSLFLCLSSMTRTLLIILAAGCLQIRQPFGHSAVQPSWSW
jgi:hypothetical protein